MEIQPVPSEALLKIAEFCNRYLAVDEEVKSYLSQRDITSDSINTFKLGAWPKNSFSIRKHIDDSTLKQAKVLWNDKDTNQEVVKFQHHRLVMPIYDANGSCVAIMGRTIHSSEKQKELGLAKYINTGYKKRLHLFGLNLAKNHIRKANKALLVEGNLDVIKAYQNQMYNVVCSTGSNLTFEQLILLARYTNKIFLSFDNDSAGDEATKKALLLAKPGVIIKEKRVPKRYKDLDEYLSKRAV